MGRYRAWAKELLATQRAWILGDICLRKGNISLSKLDHGYASSTARKTRKLNKKRQKRPCYALRGVNGPFGLSDPLLRIGGPERLSLLKNEQYSRARIDASRRKNADGKNLFQSHKRHRDIAHRHHAPKSSATLHSPASLPLDLGQRQVAWLASSHPATWHGHPWWIVLLASVWLGGYIGLMVSVWRNLRRKRP